MSEDSETIRIAVVGSGPSGFYAAGHLLAGEPQAHVDMFERLPTPWGLVRSGVAPDHPKIKSVTRIFERTAADPRFRFLGNVVFGSDITLDEVRERYHAVIYAVGTATDRAMGIPGEELPGSVAATDFVGWYNGHPDQCDFEVGLDAERAVVIGNGNVALDVARMLALTHAELAVTDIADHALHALADSAIREVVVVGRRGPAQAAFTNPELLELGELEEADVIVDPDELERGLELVDEAALGAADRKKVEILRGYAAREPSGKPKRIVLRFLASPVHIAGSDRVEAITLVHNDLVERDGALRAMATDEHETITAGLVVRAIGYRGIPLTGVPFDAGAGVIPNEDGRVVEDGAVRRGEYVVGWIKRGPSGVIGTNKKDAQGTVDALLADLEAGALAQPPVGADVVELLAQREVAVVDHAGWELIDRHERTTGAPSGRPRVKLTRLSELLHHAGAGVRDRA